MYCIVYNRYKIEQCYAPCIFEGYMKCSDLFSKIMHDYLINWKKSYSSVSINSLHDSKKICLLLLFVIQGQIKTSMQHNNCVAYTEADLITIKWYTSSNMFSTEWKRLFASLHTRLFVLCFSMPIMTWNLDNERGLCGRKTGSIPLHFKPVLSVVRCDSLCISFFFFGFGVGCWCGLLCLIVYFLCDSCFQFNALYRYDLWVIRLFKNVFDLNFPWSSLYLLFTYFRKKIHSTYSCNDS